MINYSPHSRSIRYRLPMLFLDVVSQASASQIPLLHTYDITFRDSTLNYDALIKNTITTRSILTVRDP